MGKVSPAGMLGRLLMRTVMIVAVLTLFFSLMVGMYYKSEPRAIRTAICDLDRTPLSRSIIFSINASDLYKVVNYSPDYNHIKRMLDRGEIDAGVVIPENTYKNVMNKRPVNILAALNGTANPIVTKLSLGGLKQILMTFNMQLSMHVPAEDLASVLNTRHTPKPMLNVGERIFYSPTVNMESSMLPAFMGLPMQIVAMLIILLALRTTHRQLRGVFPKLKRVRQMPLKAILIPMLTSWIMVGTAISSAYFITMAIFSIPTPVNIWSTVAVIFIFVLAMETMSMVLTLNIDNVVALTAIITLIVMPAFMYSGYLVPLEQMASFPKWFGGLFPLRYYLNSLYLVFNHHQPLAAAGLWLGVLFKFIGIFSIVIAISIVVGAIERRGFKLEKPQTPRNAIPEEN